MTPQTMQAVTFAAPAADASTTRIAARPVPEPRAGELTIDVAYAGVNFIDVMARRGDAGYADAWPFVPSLEVAGTVRALGPGVDGPPVGTRVAALTGAGGLAEVVAVAAALAVPVPDGVGLAEAAAAPGALTTAALLLGDAGRLRAGETVLVHSAGGGVGRAVARQARLAGAGLLLGTVGHARRVAEAADAGYDLIVPRGPELVAAIRERTAGRGVDLILDALGTTALEDDLAVAAAGARIVMFGNAGGDAVGALPAVGRLYAGNLSIGAFSITRLAADAPARVADALRAVLDRVAADELVVDVVTLDDLAAVPAAQDVLAAGRGSGKVVARVAG